MVNFDAVFIDVLAIFPRCFTFFFFFSDNIDKLHCT